MEDVLIALSLLSFLSTAICTLCFIIRWIMRKSKKRWGVAALVSFVLIWVFGFTAVSTSCDGEYIEISRTDPTCTSPGKVEYQCEKCGETKTETIDPTGHDFVEVSRIEPTTDTEGKIVNKCRVCGEEETVVLEILEPVTEAETKPAKEEETDSVDTSVSFDEIYRAYKANELRADDSYKNNRYQITAKVNGMETGGLFNLTGGATLTMETKVDNTIVYFYAEFDKEQEDALKTINVGDTITFEGECLSAGTWVKCELLQ